MARLFAPLLGMSLLIMAGCQSEAGPPKGVVRGSVTFKGQPVKGGIITFFQSGRPYLGKIQPDGSFKLSAAVGECQVTIEQREPGQPDPKAPPPGVLLPGKNLLPEKYAATHTSGLTFDVKPGTNKVDFDLKE
jgi:hypothetical protein